MIGVGGAAVAAPGQPLLTRGAWYTSTGIATTNTFTLNSLRVAAWQIASAATVDAFATEATVAGEAGSRLLACVYACLPGRDVPGALVASALMPVDVIGIQTLAVTPFRLTPGVYWVGGAVQLAPTTGPTMRSVDSGSIRLVAPNPDPVSPGVVSPVGYNLAGVADVPPNPFTIASATPGSGQPRIHLHVAA